MAMGLKAVGRQEARAKEMADAGYIEINPDMAHELRLFAQANMSQYAVRNSEIQRKNEIEAGIFTWVKLGDLEKYYVAQKDWVRANRINNLILGRAKKDVSVTVVGGSGYVAGGCEGGGGGSGGSSNAISAAPGTVVPPADGPQHRSSDVNPEPPLDWKGPAKRFDPFGKDFVVNSRSAPQSDVLPSGPLGKSYQPPTANGKSSWPGAKW